MSIFSRLIGATALVSACLVSVPASAAIQVFYDFASFSAAVTNAAAYNFPTSIETLTASTYTHGPATFQAGPDGYFNGYNDGTFGGAPFLANLNGPLTINSTTSGLGVYLAGYNAAETITYNAGGTSGTIAVPLPARTAFVGFTDSSGPVSVIFGPMESQELDVASFVTGTARAPVGAAPEPAAWAMLILGFGLAGYALRRRGAGSTTGLAFA